MAIHNIYEKYEKEIVKLVQFIILFILAWIRKRWPCHAPKYYAVEYLVNGIRWNVSNGYM